MSDFTYLRVLNCGMRVQDFLDFTWIYVFTATNYHVLDPANDFAVPMLVHHSEIPLWGTAFIKR